MPQPCTVVLLAGGPGLVCNIVYTNFVLQQYKALSETKFKLVSDIEYEKG